MGQVAGSGAGGLRSARNSGINDQPGEWPAATSIICDGEEAKRKIMDQLSLPLPGSSDTEVILAFHP